MYELEQNMDVEDIKEQMAFDLTQSEEWCKRQAQKMELERSRAMSPEEKAQAFKEAIRGMGRGGNQ